MRYAQLVMGPAGSGKTTYCATIMNHCKAIGRNVHIINLDPAAEHFAYESVIGDIRELIGIDDVTEDEELQLGPNGGLVFCLQHLVENMEWLEEKLGYVDDDYFLFDCPGQIELYTHLPIMRAVVRQLENWDIRVCGVFLLDAHYLNETTKFFSGALVALSAMINLEIPHVNLLSKMDLLNDQDRNVIQRFLDMDTHLLIEEEEEPWIKKHLKLTKAVASLFDDFDYVSFLPFDQTDEEGISEVLLTIDSSIQYGDDLEHKEPPEFLTNEEMDERTDD
ncbi:GPN-loop GTPase 3-like [Paramacrobiotus metropolitanus]|uniref:GPN-loop GTPase 3-like n=1 Tax=Paramacrobiotus metropolitanus TaxID=2943436 RepID=UPI002445F767|nr:GPN-loop GTPase 3-like [Paramacrobiotus metropolitanus]